MLQNERLWKNEIFNEKIGNQAYLVKRVCSNAFFLGGGSFQSELEWANAVPGKKPSLVDISVNRSLCKKTA